MAKKVFISYAHEDKAFLEKLETHLAYLKRSGLIDTWNDEEIKPGQDWDEEIKNRLADSHLILFLVSSDFIASDYCFDIEVERAMQKHHSKEAVVVPIIVRRCDWLDTPLSKLKALPNNLTPIDNWPKADDAYYDVVTGLKEFLKEMDKKSSNYSEPKQFEYSTTDNTSTLNKFSSHAEKVIKTSHATIERVNKDGKQYILKKTKKELVDFEVLKTITNQKINSTYDGITLTIATPLDIWEDGESVCELHNFIDGVNLYDLLKKNKYKFSGYYLGLIFRCTLNALSKLHELGVLHRDVSPRNLLITSNSNIYLIDVSFASRQNHQSIAFVDDYFSAPEQKKKRAVKQSDWFSLAATVFFLAIGKSWIEYNDEELKDELLKIDFGPFNIRSKPDPLIIYELLRNDLTDRPQKLNDILIDAQGTRMHMPALRGVLDLERLGFLLLYYDQKPEFCSTETLFDKLSKLLTTDEIDDPDLKKDVKSFLNGDIANPWIIE